ncbi:MAG: acetylxylan esterase [Limnochordia bacterium]
MHIRRKHLGLTFYVLLGIILCTYSVQAATQAALGGNGAITVKSAFTWTEDPLDGKPMFLVGLAAEPGGDAHLVRVDWQVKQQGWFPFWNIVIEGAANLIPAGGLQLGPESPVLDHRYEVALSFEPTLGYLTLTLYDQTTNTQLAIGQWRVGTYSGPLYAVADSAAVITSNAWFEPATSWDVGSGSTTSFLTLKHLEPEDTVLARIKAIGPLNGEYRLKDADDQVLAVLPGNQLAEGDNWLALPAAKMPLGATAVTLEYVEQGQVRFSDSRDIILGKVTGTPSSLRLDKASSRLLGTMVVRSNSRLPEMDLQARATVSVVRWNPARATYVTEAQTTKLLDLGKVTGIGPNGVSVPVALEVPSAPGIWRVDFELLADPDVVTEYVGTNLMYSTQTWTLLGNETLVVTPDRPDHLYGVGEPITFRIQVTQGNVPIDGLSVNWTLKKDGNKPLASGVAVTEKGAALVTTTFDEPGFLQLQADFSLGGQALTTVAGVGIDPLEIKPSLPVPDDFDEFWDEKKALLAQVPVRAQVKQINSGSATTNAYDVQVDALGAPVSGYLVLPKNAQPKSLPAIITLHGAGVNSASLSRARGWAEENMLAFDINAHGLPNGRESAYYTGLASGELSDYRVRGVDSRDDFYFLGMFLRVIRAIDYITTRPEWDGKTIILYGTSQGGAQSFAGAGLDSRVTFFVAGVSAMADLTGRVIDRATGWPGLGLTNHNNPAVVEQRINTVRYFDAVSMATRVKADGFFTVGFIDTTCPPTTVYAAYNNVPTKKAIYNDVWAKHENTPEATRLMREAVLNHVAEMKQR